MKTEYKYETHVVTNFAITKEELEKDLDGNVLKQINRKNYNAYRVQAKNSEKIIVMFDDDYITDFANKNTNTYKKRIIIKIRKITQYLCN